MTEQEWLVLIGIGELAGFALLVVSGVMYYMHRRRKNESHAVNELADKIISNKQNRSAKIQSLLEEHSSLEGDILSARTKELLDAENHLYQHIIDTYVKRDYHNIVRLDDKIHGLLEPYESMVSESGAGKKASKKTTASTDIPSDEDSTDSADVNETPASVIDSEDFDLEAEIDSAPGTPDPRFLAIKSADERVGYMQKKYDKAKSELGLYRDTLNRVFFEYTAMFGVDLDPDQKLSAHDIVQRLESGRLGNTDD